DCTCSCHRSSLSFRRVIPPRRRSTLFPYTTLFRSRETDERMPYEPWFDEYARVIDLQPGEMVTWPLYAPHRVHNHDCLNISVTIDRKSTRLNSSHVKSSYAVFCLEKKNSGGVCVCQ